MELTSRYCAFCGKEAERQHHLVFGYGVRDKAEKDNLKLALCNRCHTLATKREERIHDNPRAEDLSKMLGEALWMLNMTADANTQEALRKQFIERYGKNYI